MHYSLSNDTDISHEHNVLKRLHTEGLLYDSIYITSKTSKAKL